MVGLDLVSRTKESGLYSGGSGEPLKGFERAVIFKFHFRKATQPLSEPSCWRGQDKRPGNEEGAINNISAVKQ